MNKSQLLSFEVTNFRSIYKKQTLDLRGEANDARGVTALYGPNASGKSNIAKALVFMKWFVINSTNARITQTPRDPFLLRDHSGVEDSTFRIEILHNDRHMRYGFSLNKNGVVREELAEYPDGSNKAKVIFKRSSEGVNPTAVRYGYGKRLVDSTLKGSLLLTKARENNNEYANIVFEWFASKLNVLNGEPNETAQWSLENMKHNPELKNAVLDLIQDSDLWIRGFDIEEIDVPDEILNQLPFTDEVRGTIPRTAVSVKTKHAVRNKEHEIVGEQVFEMDNQESTGTRQFFELAAPILHTVANGMTLYIDEFGTYLHPDMCQFIVRMFKSPELNKHGAQLIINTHDTSLMSSDAELLAREDIVLVEKNYMEETLLTPLTNKSVREGESFEKRYREGMYGAKPQIKR